jgi:GDPmannose 4,6-dehydratase
MVSKGQLKQRNGLLGRVLIEVDPRYFRPTEVDLLVGDPSKARSKLGWQHKISFEQLVAEMVAQTLRN